MRTDYWTSLITALGIILGITSCVGNPPKPPETSLKGDEWLRVYDKLLDTYVAEGGGVYYQQWHQNTADREKLAEVVGAIARASPPEQPDAALAFYLNAYNAWILYNILEKYPVGGPLADDPFFFHKDSIVVADEPMSFDHLEQKIIRGQFDEPRIHFALNCASISCPPLPAEPLRAESLDQQLDALTRDFLNTPQAATTGAQRETVQLSKLFEWYKEDFEQNGSVIDYINLYRGESTMLPENSRISYQEYDWSLNEAAAKSP